MICDTCGEEIEDGPVIKRMIPATNPPSFTNEHYSCAEYPTQSDMIFPHEEKVA